MTWNEFIFSEKTSRRFSRHLALWICFCFYFFIVNFFPKNSNDLVNSQTYIEAFQKMIYIPISIFSVYVASYFLLPRFILKGRYVSFFILAFCLCLIDLASAFLITKLLSQFTQKLPFAELPLQIRVFQPVIYGVGLGLTASGFAIIIKLLKVRYLKQKENERLQQQKINTELQTIKTNFHPHFLSDALKNIADLIRNHSKESPATILKLSDLLSFILYENEEESIPLEKELLMVKDYLALEKSFYNNKILIQFKQQGDVSNRKIAPLILLSLVQNCCEQFLISLQQKLIIEIETKTEGQHFIFRLGCNGYYENINGIPQQSTGLNHALRRIQMTYPGKHKLDTHTENGFFSMTLVLDPEDILENRQTKTEEKVFHEPA